MLLAMMLLACAKISGFFESMVLTHLLAAFADSIIITPTFFELCSS
jgi:hypothetical protein